MPLILSIWIISNCHRYDLYQQIMKLLVNVARQMWRHLNVATFVEIDVSGRGNASSCYICYSTWQVLHCGIGITSYCHKCKNMGISWWRHQMEPFSAWLAQCAGISLVPVNSPHKGQWRGAFMFSLIYAWINDWVNNREAGDLRRQRGHYDVIVMCQQQNITIAVKSYSMLNTFPIIKRS